MNERLFLNHQPVKSKQRDVSNILYDEMRKHDGNRYLVYVFDEEKEFEFDEDFTVAAQERDYHFITDTLPDSELYQHRY